MTGPPERERPVPPQNRPSRENTDAAHATPNGRQAVHDALAAIRRRPYKPSTGLRADGYREGYAAALRWTQREFHDHLDEIGRARLAAVVARSDAA